MHESPLPKVTRGCRHGDDSLLRHVSGGASGACVTEAKPELGLDPIGKIAEILHGQSCVGDIGNGATSTCQSCACKMHGWLGRDGLQLERGTRVMWQPHGSSHPLLNSPRTLPETGRLLTGLASLDFPVPGRVSVHFLRTLRVLDSDCILLNHHLPRCESPVHLLHSPSLPRLHVAACSKGGVPF